MGLAFTLIALIKNLLLLPPVLGGGVDPMILTTQLTNIWVVVGVVHGWIHSRARLKWQNEQLCRITEELEASNEELAAREEEVARQNEELQSQTEELERQTEELQCQTEELEQQAADLHETNLELGRRERGMQTLLDSSRWLRSDMNEGAVVNGVCRAAIQVMGESAAASAVVERAADKVRLRGNAGYGLNGPANSNLEFGRSFASLVLERGQTGYIEDIRKRPDIELLLPVAGKPFRSVISTPIWLDGQAVAALEVYCCEPRKWSEQEFRVLEWLAAQAALSLQAVRFQQEIEAKRADAEAASLEKSRFLAAVSHDVRTPANAISLLAELIERMARDPGQRDQIPELAHKLGSNARALIDLVSDVLDLTRFDSGRIELQVSEFSLSSLIGAEIMQTLPIAENKGLILKHEAAPRDVRLRTDRMKLARVLSNLIGNAVKFTDRGQVGVHYEGNGTGPVHLIVSDTGPGISPDDLPRIFDEFFQIMNPERDREKGTGLGLAICRRLLDGLGCKVRVESLIGKGTTFTISIPRELIVDDGGEDELHLDFGMNGARKEPGGVGDPAGRPLRDLRILLVEDHDVTRMSMSRLLEDHGAKVTEVRNGREALECLARGTHEVLLLDLNLPDVDGGEILRSLKPGQRESLKCILVLSGDVRPERIEEVRRLGAMDMIPKPLRIEDVTGAIAKAIR
jgi:signal transduction histidine kinase